MLPLDAEIRNGDFEEGRQSPEFWTVIGSGKSEWVSEPVHGGKKAISVTDAGNGIFSGWSMNVPVRPDRTYSFGGFIKGGNLNPDGFVGGGAFCLQFLDYDGQEIGNPIVSDAVGANKDWTKVMTRATQPPANAAQARLTAGLQFCRGSAWFDDLSIEIANAETKDVATVERKVPDPSKDVTYAKNLLKNGDVEEGADGKPAGWTYFGRSERDWTEDEIKAFHTNGRPDFKIGRARGEWSETAYSGKYSLLNVSIDPPLSKNHQWYGRNPVDGYWLSEPMPCMPGRTYVASAWILPGAEISEAWFGPFELQFFNDRKKNVGQVVRCSLSKTASGQWSFWATMPYKAPESATSMRLRFGQELKADRGGWGRTYADNLSVWELPEGTETPDFSGLSGKRYFKWFSGAISALKPPYISSPAKAPAYESCTGRAVNTTEGNIFGDPSSKLKVKFLIQNLLGEDRKVNLRVTRTDWLGNASGPFEAQETRLPAFSEIPVGMEIPPSNSFGAFHLDVQILENNVQTGAFSGRYAVLPPLKRPRTAENRLGVTPLTEIKADGSSREKEIAKLMQIAGFGISWVRMHFDPESPEKAMSVAKKQVMWYRSIGIDPVLQLMVNNPRKQNYESCREIGKKIAKEFKGLVAAYGDWAIETANSASPFRGGGKDRLTDLEYDTILSGIYDGIKAETPEALVLIGNIATDFEAKTIERLYGKPANGKFDGAILNSYMGHITVAQASLAAFDRHNDKNKTLWCEEHAEQRSPFEGEARRYGEGEGARNLVRHWLTLLGAVGDRMRCVTMWGFCPNTDADINMLSSELQPRPQFVAHAVMADAIADARLKANRSAGNYSLYEWERGDSVLLTAWANAGESDLTLEVPSGKLIMTDLMGNSREEKAVDNIFTVHLTSAPVFISSKGKLETSKRVEVSLGNGTISADKPQLRVRIKNNTKNTVSVQLKISGPITGDGNPKTSIEAGKTYEIMVPVKGDLPAGTRSNFRAEAVTEKGTYAESASLNFACAAKAEKAPSLDGTWNGWEKSVPIVFGTGPDEIRKPNIPGESHEGPSDIKGKFRMMWDKGFFYLGVESFDDSFVSQPARGASGFMADSIEFAFQPDNIRMQSAAWHEFELYLPAGQDKFAASRRFPSPSVITGWNAVVKPTGERGNVIYQLAIPWKELDVSNPKAGKVISFALVLNDQDKADSQLGGNRGWVNWFNGVCTGKNPEQFGDVVLAE
ncbi:MAG: sugar-binding protein [Victivallales bacterium]|jgi:hypothetical protein